MFAELKSDSQRENKHGHLSVFTSSFHSDSLLLNYRILQRGQALEGDWTLQPTFGSSNWKRTLSPLHMSWCLGLIQIPDQSAWSGAEVKVTHRRCIQLIQLTCSLSDTHTHCSTSAVKPLSSAWLFLSLLHRLIKCFHLNILKWCYSKATAGNLIE